MSETWVPVIVFIAVLVMIFNFGGMLGKYLQQGDFLEACEQNKEFLISDKAVVKCEIIKDFRK